MFCQKCGKELEEGAKFCSNCGEAITKEEKIHLQKQDVQKKSPAFIKLTAIFLLCLVSIMAVNLRRSINKIETTANDSAEVDGHRLRFGDLLDLTIVNDTLVVKAKINSRATKNMTIHQNYYNVEDLIQNQGADTFNCIDYWAVADMSNGDEQKVISFTLNKATIEAIKNEKLPANMLGDYVEDLFIHPGLN